MKQEKATKKTRWAPLQMVGVAVSILGILMLAYSAYSLLSFGSHGAYASTSFRHVYNGTPVNDTALNGSARAYYSGRVMIAGGRPGLSLILSGVLMLLLGITVFKYGKLKASMGHK